MITIKMVALHNENLNLKGETNLLHVFFVVLLIRALNVAVLSVFIHGIL